MVPMWPEYGGALPLLNALAADGHDVADVGGSLFERGRQTAVAHFAHIGTPDAQAVLGTLELDPAFHVVSIERDGHREAIVDDGWTNDYEPRRFRLVLAPERPRLMSDRPGARPTPVGRIRRELEPLSPDPRGRYEVPESGAFGEGWGRLAVVARTLMSIGADVRPTFEGYEDLSEVVHFAGGTLVRGDLDWSAVLGAFDFPAGVHVEVLPGSHALVRDIPEPYDPLRATFALVFAPSRPASLLRRIFD
ncbi:hypothetical protein [Curtobacterium sp. ISL-83]|uniref:hypothetical protein n=1 Tax=Curtobacterium sp. ISL-83 TaxID=2819145 RepID=UPI001BE7EE61|nr:hypothetical protein [Curtobacterium sp. ISL-83]MBT2501881.1 hypothetical protein [Curtobacterium sp. ISL-83]